MRKSYNSIANLGRNTNLDYDYDIIPLCEQYAVGKNANRDGYKKTICSDSDLEKITKLEEDFFKETQKLNKNQ